MTAEEKIASSFSSLMAVGRIMALKYVHFLITKICEYVEFHGKRGARLLWNYGC